VGRKIPVALLGTATVPAVYWVSRQLGFSRGISLGVALILAVSYHHIFFSQNARGYIGLVFFSLIASGLLVRALQTDRLQTWVLYVVVMFLNFATLLTSGYVLAAHMIVGAIALYIIYRRGLSLAPMVRRLAVVFGLTGFLAFQLYALILPHAYVRAQAKYTSDGGYFSLFSTDLLIELMRNVSAGIGVGAGIQALAILVIGSSIAAVGLVILLRRNWALTLALSLPSVLSLIFLIVNGLTFSPRFFLPALPIALMAAVQGVYTIGALAGRRLGECSGALAPRLATAALVLMVLAVCLASLRHYYSTPKQAYRASIEYVENQRTNGEPVIVADLAEQGYRYYGNLMGGRKDQDYYFVHSVEELDKVLSTSSQGESYPVTTLPRFLRLRKPDLDARIQQEWHVIRSFPGTIGDGQISVWTSRQP
jgi:mannosyltransferase